MRGTLTRGMTPGERDSDETAAPFEAPPRHRLVVATTLPRDGCCGVQTHFRTIVEYARAGGVAAEIASPYDAPRWLQRLANAVARALGLVDREVADLWRKWSLMRLLRRQLRFVLGRSDSARVTVYAQDPLSTEAALGCREGSVRKFRIATVVHFNVSEAEEHAANGKARAHGRMWRALMAREARVLPKADALIFVSSHMRRIVEQRVPRVRDVTSVVLPNFVGPPPITVGEQVPYAPRDLIAIGTLEPRKNQGYLLEILAAANALGHRYTLSLVGDGPSRREFEARARELGVAHQVAFIGYVKAASARIQGHRALVHGACHENFPFVLIEAMRAGVPVLAPPVGGVPEAFDDGVEGAFWPLDDADRAARILVGILESKSRHSAMSAAGQRRYRQRYSADAVGPLWLCAILGDVPESAGADSGGPAPAQFRGSLG